MMLSLLHTQQESEFSIITNLKEVAKTRGWLFKAIAPPEAQIHYPSTTIEEDMLYVLQHWGQLLNFPASERMRFIREEKFYHLHCSANYEIDETFRCTIPYATIINPTGLVITSDLEIVAQSLDRQEINIDLDIKSIREQVDRNQVLPGTYVSLLSYWSYTCNFAHWLMDCLPKLALLEALSDDLKFIIPDQSPNYLIDSLKLLGIQENQLVKIKEKSLLVEKLILCHASQVSGRPSQTHLLTVRNRLLASFNGNKTSSNENSNSIPRRIYVSRSHSSRSMINEDEILTILEDFKFEVVHCENMSLLKQISIFSEAGVVLGPHGAGIYNQIFCESGAIIIEIYNKEYWHHSSRIVSSFMGHSHWHIFGENMSEDWQTWVDPLKLKRILSLALCDKSSYIPERVSVSTK